MQESTAPASASLSSAPRLASIDAYRGLAMLLLVFLDAPNNWTAPLREAYLGSVTAAIVSQFEHVEWAGIVLWDMIQPSFMFVVGVSAAFSYAGRARRGESFGRMLAHAIYRSLLLILIGVFLRSVGRGATNWTLEDVISQIGLGYVFLFLLWNRGWKIQLGAVALIVVGYWLLFALWPLPSPGYDYAAVNGHAYYDGFWGHWNKNANPGHYFDSWLLNLFPRPEPWVANAGGYNTLNFIPSLATMILGLLAGELLRGDQPARRKLAMLLLSGAGCLLLGLACHFGGICPIVKKLWTPSFTLASGGLCLLAMGILYAIVDLAGWRRWAFPAIVVGMNSIAAYAMIHLIAGWTLENYLRHLGPAPFAILGPAFEPLLQNLAVGAMIWLICYWMYRRQLFLRL